MLMLPVYDSKNCAKRKSAIQYNTIQHDTIQHDALQCHITLHYITSHYITSHHVVRYHITLRHTSSYCTTSHQTMSNHIASLHTTSHHITSNYVKSYHTASRHIMRQYQCETYCAIHNSPINLTSDETIEMTRSQQINSMQLITIEFLDDPLQGRKPSGEVLGALHEFVVSEIGQLGHILWQQKSIVQETDLSVSICRCESQNVVMCCQSPPLLVSISHIYCDVRMCCPLPSRSTAYHADRDRCPAVLIPVYVIE